MCQSIGLEGYRTLQGHFISLAKQSGIRLNFAYLWTIFLQLQLTSYNSSCLAHCNMYPDGLPSMGRQASQMEDSRLDGLNDLKQQPHPQKPWLFPSFGPQIAVVGRRISFFYFRDRALVLQWCIGPVTKRVMALLNLCKNNTLTFPSLYPVCFFSCPTCHHKFSPAWKSPSNPLMEGW